MKEEWKDILGYEGKYEVSNLGNVRNAKTNSILCKSIDRYCGVKLSKNNIKKFKSIHRLVAESFIPNPNNLPQVNHIDGNKLNNCVNNLEWCTRSENMKHAYKFGLEKPTKISPVLQFTIDGSFIKKYQSIKEAQKYNKNCSKIGACCQGMRKTAGGYVWKYKELEMKNNDIRRV